jgi:hypothetical protein
MGPDPKAAMGWTKARQAERVAAPGMHDEAAEGEGGMAPCPHCGGTGRVAGPAAPGAGEEGAGPGPDDGKIVEEAVHELDEQGVDDETRDLGNQARDDEAQGQNPPSWVEDEAIWTRAKAAVDPEGEGVKYDEPWAVVVAVYRKMGGESKKAAA